MNHTPGPWISPWDLPDGSPEEDFSYITGADGKCVIGANWWDGPYLAVTREDAALICAAPDLLEALEGLHTTVMELYRVSTATANYGDGQNRYADQDTQVAAARAAIAKARGAS